MDDIPTIIGINLKKIRKNKQMTLETLSQISGVSISMLGEIERGVTNPTITILWKIADGLKISLSDLIQQHEPDISVVYQKDAAASLIGDSYKILSLFKFDADKKFEVFCKLLEPGAYFESEGHRFGVEEYLFICGGTLTLNVGNKEYLLSQGDAIRFSGENIHSYHNQGETTVSAFTILYYASE